VYKYMHGAFSIVYSTSLCIAARFGLLLVRRALPFGLLLFRRALRFGLRVRRRRKLVAALKPHSRELLVNLLLPLLPLLDLGEPLTQLGKFLLDARLLALGADALELPLVALLALAERERVRVVPLEGGACRDCDESYYASGGFSE
jgi:hypothetical protein